MSDKQKRIFHRLRKGAILVVSGYISSENEEKED